MRCVAICLNQRPHAHRFRVLHRSSDRADVSGSPHAHRTSRLRIVCDERIDEGGGVRNEGAESCLFHRDSHHLRPHCATRSSIVGRCACYINFDAFYECNQTRLNVPSSSRLLSWRWDEKMIQWERNDILRAHQASVSRSSLSLSPAPSLSRSPATACSLYRSLSIWKWRIDRPLTRLRDRHGDARKQSCPKGNHPPISRVSALTSSHRRKNSRSGTLLRIGREWIAPGTGRRLIRVSRRLPRNYMI